MYIRHLGLFPRLPKKAPFHDTTVGLPSRDLRVHHTSKYWHWSLVLSCDLESRHRRTWQWCTWSWKKTKQSAEGDHLQISKPLRRNMICYPFAFEEVEEWRYAVEPHGVQVVGYCISGVRPRSEVFRDAVRISIHNTIRIVVILIVQISYTRHADKTTELIQSCACGYALQLLPN